MSEDFDIAVDFVLRHEGGDDPDLDGGTSRGIRQSTYNTWLDKMKKPRALVRYASDQEIREIYQTIYWEETGAQALEFPWDVIHFDTCVQHGQDNAKSMRHASRSPVEYLMRRVAFYAGLASRKQENRQYLRGWINRMVDLYDLVCA